MLYYLLGIIISFARNENYLTLQEIELAFKETNNLINKNTSLINTFYSDIKKEKENFVKSIKR